MTFWKLDFLFLFLRTTKTGDKRRPDGPLDSYAELTPTYTIIIVLPLYKTEANYIILRIARVLIGLSGLL